MFRLLFPLCLVAAAGCATDAETAARDAKSTARTEAEIARVLDGRTAAAPERCIDQSRVTRIRPYRDTILYDYEGAILRNDTQGGCFGLGRGDIVVTRSISSRICEGDIITTVSPTSRAPTGSCALGAFVPYRR